jgi:hypothetical protein
MVDMRGKMTPALRVRIPPPKQAAAAAPAPEPVRSGNGAAAVAPTQKLMAAAPPVDPELEDDPVKPLADELPTCIGRLLNSPGAAVGFEAMAAAPMESDLS